MPVKKIFWDNPYLTQVTARITSINGDIITLDQTVAYAFSGGQQSDVGTIGGYAIIKAEKINQEIFYTLDSARGLSEGCEVSVSIDWEKRYRIMKLHFAAEIILELLYQNFDRPEKIGANITTEKARLDFCWSGNISSAFPLLEAKAADLIRDNRIIISAFSNEETEERYWEITGFARVPCGGTHLKKTGEVGNIKLKRVNLGGGKERIEIYLAAEK
ncbi:MAG: hypothetical protein ACM3NT_09445 [Methylocystaceae bacterium]